MAAFGLAAKGGVAAGTNAVLGLVSKLGGYYSVGSNLVGVVGSRLVNLAAGRRVVDAGVAVANKIAALGPYLLWKKID